MTTTSSPPDERPRTPLRRRGTAMLLALLVEGLIALAFLALAPQFEPEKHQRDPVVFGITAEGDETPEPTKREEKKTERRAQPAKAEKADKPRPDPVVEPKATEPEAPVTPSYIKLTRSEFAAADLSTKPAGAPAARNSEETGGGASPGDSQLAGGRGPNGELLYAAEWYVRPTHAQLNPYIPARTRESGWGLIACRTVANYRVEDCRELGDAPRGSGLAGAVRQAAWQFRVRPPRKGGRDLVGAWVAIRVDYEIRQAD